jgi:hypothetical protein
MRHPELVVRAQRIATRRQQVPRQQVPHQAGPLQSGPVGPDQARDMAAGPASWTSGELPGPGDRAHASWPPGMPSAADQPSVSA